MSVLGYSQLFLNKAASSNNVVLVKQISAYNTTALTCTSNTVDMTGVTTIVIAVTFNIFSGGTPTNTITDNKGNTYTLATHDMDSFGYIYYKTGLTSANVSSTMTFTCATTTNYETVGIFFTVYGLTGLSGLDAYNSTGSGGGLFSSIVTPSITPAYAGEFIVVAGGNIYYGPTSAMSGGFILDQSISSGAYGNYNFQGHLITSSTSAISTTITNGGSNYAYWGVCIASFH